jgi:RNA polymerase sigma factor FliA
MSPPSSNQNLVEECQGLVRTLATTIHRRLPRSVQLDDLIAYGQVGLLEAARDFDATRGNRFSTYAYYRIRGSIYDGLAKMSWSIRTEHQQARYQQMAGEVLGESAEEEDRGATQRPPEADAAWFRDLSQALAVVYLATRVSTFKGAPGNLADTLQASPVTEAMDREIRARLNELINSLPAEEGALIRSTYFEGMTLQEAGERLGISRSWASRLHAKALQRLARSLKLLGLTA